MWPKHRFSESQPNVTHCAYSDMDRSTSALLLFSDEGGRPQQTEGIIRTDVAGWARRGRGDARKWWFTTGRHPDSSSCRYSQLIAADYRRHRFDKTVNTTNNCLCNRLPHFKKRRVWTIQNRYKGNEIVRISKNWSLLGVDRMAQQKPKPVT